MVCKSWLLLFPVDFMKILWTHSWFFLAGSWNFIHLSKPGFIFYKKTSRYVFLCRKRGLNSSFWSFSVFCWYALYIFSIPCRYRFICSLLMCFLHFPKPQLVATNIFLGILSLELIYKNSCLPPSNKVPVVPTVFLCVFIVINSKLFWMTRKTILVNRKPLYIKSSRFALPLSLPSSPFRENSKNPRIHPEAPATC